MRASRTALLGPVAAALVVSARAEGKTIDVTPADDFTKIEAAVAGDVVEIEPGTYKFLVHLDQHGTSSSPIVIRAKDPGHPPVWDLDGITLDGAPGSYTGGDRGRGCWQVFGSYYEISGVVFTNCRNTDMNAAGLRYNGADHVTLRDVLVKDNDNGITGIGTNILVEFADLDHNGNPSASAETHNLYIYDGSFTIRYSYIHDSAQGENFHFRCVDCLAEYDWFARANNYEGDMMPNGATTGVAQKAVFRGNVFVQKAAPENHSQTFVMFNDTGVSGVTMEMDFYWNTFIGNGSDAILVHHANAKIDATKSELSNNVIVGATNIFGYDDASKATTSGTNNWMLATATSTGALGGTISGVDPMLDADFRPKTGSPVIGKASTSVLPLPTFEYFQNETVTRMYRVRASANDIGAFESTTTGTGTGPYGAPPDAGAPDAASDAGSDSASTSDAKADGGGPDAITTRPDGASIGDTGSSGPDDRPSSDSGGCGCALVGRDVDGAAAFGLVAALLALSRRRPRP